MTRRWAPAPTCTRSWSASPRKQPSRDGPGAVAGAVTQAAERMVGFELQMGPYAVAELRTADMLASHGAARPPGGMRLYVTDTLDDPYAAQTQIGYGLQLIAASRRKRQQGQGQGQRHCRDRQPALQGTRRGRRRLGRERRQEHGTAHAGDPGGLLRRRGGTVQGQAEEPLHLLLALGDLEGLGIHRHPTRWRRRHRLLHLHLRLPRRARRSPACASICAATPPKAGSST